MANTKQTKAIVKDWVIVGLYESGRKRTLRVSDSIEHVYDVSLRTATKRAVERLEWDDGYSWNAMGIYELDSLGSWKSRIKVVRT